MYMCESIVLAGCQIFELMTRNQSGSVDVFMGLIIMLLNLLYRLEPLVLFI